jgi:hypothetical protein
MQIPVQGFLETSPVDETVTGASYRKPDLRALCVFQCH